jgi:hypothetical protein
MTVLHLICELVEQAFVASRRRVDGGESAERPWLKYAPKR